MTQYELEVLMKIIMGLVALALYGIVCYVFGKSKAEIFPEDEDEPEDALNEAYEIFPEDEDEPEDALNEAYENGYEAGYSASMQHIIKFI